MTDKSPSKRLSDVFRAIWVLK